MVPILVQDPVPVPIPGRLAFSLLEAALFPRKLASIFFFFFLYYFFLFGSCSKSCSGTVYGTGQNYKTIPVPLM